MNKALTFLEEHPYISHSVLALLYSSIIMVSLVFFVSLLNTCVIAAVITAAFFYGREAGQLDHDLSRAHTGTVWSRFYTSNICVFWSLDVNLQWLLPALTASAWCAIWYNLV